MSRKSPPTHFMTTKYGVFSEPTYLSTGAAAIAAAVAADDAAAEEDPRAKPWVPATNHGTVGLAIISDEDRWLDV